MFQGLRTVIYPAPDLEAAKEWWSSGQGCQPYVDDLFYVGSTVGGYELGLDPEPDVEAGAVSYWGVRNIEQALGTLMGGGAQPRTDIFEVGEGIRVATVLSPTEDVVGVIENPHFKLPD